MFHKALMLTAVAVCVVASGAGSALAGSGYGTSSGHVKATPHRPYQHIHDTVWQKHVAWCSARFKTYKWRDNTFQPYNGPRKQCWSPHIPAAH